jgi:putative oxidoreductase
MDQGILVARLIIGLLMAAHGSQKAFAWFGGHGLTRVSGFFEGLGFRPGRPFAAAAAYGELVSGLLVAFGFLGPVGPALMLSVMIVAAISAHWKNGLFATSSGIEVPLLYATVATALALTGPGRISLDTLLGLDSFWTPALSWAAIAVAVVGAIGNLAMRRTPVASRA